jgi:DNA topoisomerase-1
VRAFKKVSYVWSFIKWSGLFYQCEQKYNFDNLSQSDIEALIEDKPKKTYITQLGRRRNLVEKAR